MTTELQVLDVGDFNALCQWVEQGHLPEEMRGRLEKLLTIYQSLAKGKSGQRALLFELRQAMGIIPRSEKGRLDENK